MIENEPFGGWIIEHELGHGGFGRVYKATKDGFSSAIKQIIIPSEEVYIVALKRFNGDNEKILNYYKPEAEQMRKEIETMRNLSGIVGVVMYQDHTVREYSERSGWEILIRMEYLTPLEDYIRENGITIKQIIKMEITLSNALQECFEENILHRDIKENNILVDKRGRFKLADFGVSKNIENSIAATVIGTFGYMAPEVQKNGEYDHRADIYSLGIVMYKLLNGGLMPFMPKNGTVTDERTSRMAMLTGKPFPKPMYGTELIAKVVLKACEYRQEDRYSMFSEIGYVLNDVLNETDRNILNEYTIVAETGEKVSQKESESTANHTDDALLGFDETLNADEYVSVPFKTELIPVDYESIKDDDAEDLKVEHFSKASTVNVNEIVGIPSKTEIVPVNHVTVHKGHREQLKEVNSALSDGAKIDYDNKSKSDKKAVAALKKSKSKAKWRFLGLNRKKIIIAVYIVGICSVFGNISYILMDGGGLSDVKAISAGDQREAALKRDGTVWSWGWNRDSNMLLGDGTETKEDTLKKVKVKDLTDVESISEGASYTVALKRDGTVWTWGQNGWGQLGDGTKTDSSIPVQVKNLTAVKSISAGKYYTIALKKDGTVWAWGSNKDGQLGDGTKVSRSIPVQINDLTGITAISACYEHTIALKGDGTVWAWGNYRDIEGNVMSTEPAEIKGLTDIIAISAGQGYTVVLKENGTVWAWGDNEHGQLGDGSKISYYSTKINYSTKLVQVKNLANVEAISAGAHHTVALKKDGTVWTWGWNCAGQLGDGSIWDSDKPVQSKNLTDVEAISAGDCSTMALKKDGIVWAWGDTCRNKIGKILGNTIITPVQVKNGLNVNALLLIDTVALFVIIVGKFLDKKMNVLKQSM